MLLHLRPFYPAGNCSVMAGIAFYGKPDYDEIADDRNLSATVDLLLGILSFPDVSIDIYNTELRFTVYEKSFWKKKERACVSLNYIEDYRADIVKLDYYVDLEDTPAYYNVLIGLNFSSIYTSYYAPVLQKKYELGLPRNELVSYGLLKDTLHFQRKMMNTPYFQGFEKVFMTFSPSPIEIHRRLKDNLDDLNRKLEFFQNF